MSNVTASAPLAEKIAALASVKEQTGLRITADDVMGNAKLMQVANEYTQSYSGDFPFMLSMVHHHVISGQFFSDAQAAAVLNCAIAEYNYQSKRQAVQQAQEIVASAPVAYDHTRQYVTDGWYTIVGPKGGHRTLRLTTIEDGDSVKQWLAYLNGADNENSYLTVGTVHGNEVRLFRKNEGKYQDIVAAARFLIRNAANIGEYGRQYALRSGRCYVCNRKLTTPESIAAGIGPVCAAK